MNRTPIATVRRLAADDLTIENLTPRLAVPGRGTVCVCWCDTTATA